MKLVISENNGDAKTTELDASNAQTISRSSTRKHVGDEDGLDVVGGLLDGEVDGFFVGETVGR